MPPLVIFSDLDGTLLDHFTYSWEEARPAIERCSALSVPVVLVSSKTRAEIDSIQKQMRIEAPFVSENGGGVFIPRGLSSGPPAGAVKNGGFWKIRLGPDYSVVVNALKEISSELNLAIRGFADMDTSEISRLTGLDPALSQLAKKREFDEPFTVRLSQHADERLLILAARRKGLCVTSGGRFRHIHGHGGKGAALDWLVGWYEAGGVRVVTAALGDSPNDFEMLERADYPILVKSVRSFPELSQRLARLKVTQKPGPAGWNRAVMELLDKMQRGIQ